MLILLNDSIHGIGQLCLLQEAGEAEEPVCHDRSRTQPQQRRQKNVPLGGQIERESQTQTKLSLHVKLKCVCVCRLCNAALLAKETNHQRHQKYFIFKSKGKGFIFFDFIHFSNVYRQFDAKRRPTMPPDFTGNSKNNSVLQYQQAIQHIARCYLCRQTCFIVASVIRRDPVNPLHAPSPVFRPPPFTRE